jgi:uncharacterized membrane protein (DUF106 family)
MMFFSIGLAGAFSLIYWRFLDIERKEELKEKLNEHQEKMKEAREEDNSDKVSEHMSKSMELNQKFMMLNLKPMLVTMLFVSLFFPWLGSTFSPTIQLNETGGTYSGELKYAGESVPVTVEGRNNTLMTVNDQEVSVGEEFQAYGMQWEYVSANNNSGFLSSYEGFKAKVSAEFIPLPVDLWYIGDALNWLGFYILMAMPLTYLFRKKLGIN